MPPIEERGTRVSERMGKERQGARTDQEGVQVGQGGLGSTSPVLAGASVFLRFAQIHFPFLKRYLFQLR